LAVFEFAGDGIVILVISEDVHRQGSRRPATGGTARGLLFSSNTCRPG
jgi:hypothetical protein